MRVQQPITLTKKLEAGEINDTSFKYKLDIAKIKRESLSVFYIRLSEKKIMAAR